MKYWKQGFYDEPQDGAVEITEEYYNELLNGQSNGYTIEENTENYPILRSNAPSTVEEFKTIKISEITTYDKSEEINSFTIQSVKLWLDKETRTGLKLRFDAEKASGVENTTLWYGNIKIPLNVDVAISLLLQVELYASGSYDTTQQHIANVMNLTTIENVKVYDFTVNYPDKLVF